MDKYLLGALPSTPDVRDYSVRVTKAALPTNFMQNIGLVYEQAAGNCVSQAIRSCMYQIHGGMFGVDMLYGGARTAISPGLYPNNAANFLVKYGMAPLTADPSEREVTDVIDYYNANKTRLEAAAAPFAGCS